MAFGEHDYEVDQGATFQQSVTYTAKNAAGADIPVNLGTYEARMDVRYANTKEADYCWGINFKRFNKIKN
mgnify:CR=1 FL=1